MIFRDDMRGVGEGFVLGVFGFRLSLVNMDFDYLMKDSSENYHSNSVMLKNMKGGKKR